MVIFFFATRENCFYNGRELKVVNMYKYLVLTFSYTFNDLADRAKKMHLCNCEIALIGR